jgi:hypothetical protein
MEHSKEEEFAIQQFIGFKAADNGETIEDLALAMDLSKSEWEKIKREEGDGLLTNEYIRRLDKFFEED